MTKQDVKRGITQVRVTRVTARVKAPIKRRRSPASRLVDLAGASMAGDPSTLPDRDGGASAARRSAHAFGTRPPRGVAGGYPPEGFDRPPPRAFPCTDPPSPEAPRLPLASGPRPAALLAERERTHGDFGRGARFVENLIEAMRGEGAFDALPPAIRHALRMDAVKTARILAGDWRHEDHWRDKQGYAEAALAQIAEMRSLR